MSNCSRCRYAGNPSARSPSLPDTTGNVECHRYPPSGRVNVFPLMRAADWCGEWERSASAPSLEAALTAPSGDGVPGMVLVPREPTEAMLNAARFYFTDRWTLQGHSLALSDLWAAMLSASTAGGGK